MAKSITELNVNHRVFTRHEDDYLAWAKRQDVEESDAEIKKHLSKMREKLGIKEKHILPKRKQYAAKKKAEVKQTQKKEDK